MKLISLLVPEHYLRELDDLVKRGFYPHRAEAIRLAILDLLRKERVEGHLTPSPPILQKEVSA